MKNLDFIWIYFTINSAMEKKWKIICNYNYLSYCSYRINRIRDLYCMMLQILHNVLI